MSFRTINRRGARVFALGGLLLALLAAAGCGRHAAPPPATVKPKTDTANTNVVAAAPTNQAGESYSSVFEDLPPQKGKDPFFPASHRRDPKVEATPDTTAPVDAVLVVKAILYTSKNSQAEINNVIFEAGEQHSVRVPNGKVMVKCIAIGTNSVQIQLEGEAEPKTLPLEKKKN